MIHGWRTRLHYWSRRGDFVKKTALFVVIGGFILASVIIQLTPDGGSTIAMDPVEQKIRNDWQRLRNESEANPRELSRWLRQVMPNTQMLSESLGMAVPTWAEFEKKGELFAYEVRPLLSKHASSPDIQKLLVDYIAACLAEKEPAGIEAAKRLHDQAHQEKPPPLANELHASVLLRTDHDADALTALMRETMLFADALPARETATRLALRLKDESSLRQIVSAGWLENLPAMVEHHVGLELGDLLMQWHGLLRHRLSSLPFMALMMTALVAVLWYIILVQHTPEQSWRWIWPITPIVAGIASVWPTLSLVAWQENVMGIVDEVPFPWDLWHLIIGVGLREEMCKLILAAFFMPWLLWRRAPGLALMTGAFVGLGFAVEENIDYYQDFGDGVALVRFLSANFMHVAMTGLTTHALYDMLRSRFHRAQQFLITFFTIVVAHALYDFHPPEMTGLGGYLPMLILAYIAWQFWDRVEAEMPHSRQLISPASIFLIGTALVIAVSFLVSVIENPTREALIGTAAQCVSFLPVALIYWRRFEGSLFAR
jgi:RsiW-degrading membrane proteinase PrsW (M82 family)